MDKRHRLTKDAEFKRARSEGRHFGHPLLVMYVVPNQLETVRVGFSTSRRIGKAVARNRVKRLLREAMRLRIDEIIPGWDILLIARQSASRATFHEIDAAVAQLLRRAGVTPARKSQ